MEETSFGGQQGPKAVKAVNIKEKGAYSERHELKTRAKGGQDAGHHNGRLCRMLDAIFCYCRAVTYLCRRMCNIARYYKLILMARLLQLNVKSHSLHDLQSRLPQCFYENPVWTSKQREKKKSTIGIARDALTQLILKWILHGDRKAMEKILVNQKHKEI